MKFDLLKFQFRDNEEFQKQKNGEREKIMKLKKCVRVLAAGIAALMLTACGTGGQNSYVAKVNGKEISYETYQNNYMIFKKQIESNVGADIWNQDSGEGKTYGEVFKEQILEKLIEDELVAQAAEKEGIKIDEAEVDKQMEEFKKQIETNQEYKEYLKQNNIGDDFIRYQMSADNLLRDFKADYEKKYPVSEEDMKKYYEENQEMFRNNEVRASHILVSTIDEKTRLPLSEEEKAKAKAKAEDLLKRVKAGEDFAELAKQHSQDPASGQVGGDLGFFPKGQMVKPFEDAAFSMNKGQVSDLVESNFGYHIIKVTDKKDEMSTFDEVKDRIRENLAGEFYQSHINELKNQAKIEKNEELLKKEDKKEEK